MASVEVGRSRAKSNHSGYALRSCLVPRCDQRQARRVGRRSVMIGWVAIQRGDRMGSKQPIWIGIVRAKDSPDRLREAWEIGK